LAFQSLWRMSLAFLLGLCWTCRMLLVLWPFSNVDSNNPWAWEIFPSSNVFFDLSLQCFIVFIEKVFLFLH
jgi:hypothetical protein